MSLPASALSRAVRAASRLLLGTGIAAILVAAAMAADPVTIRVGGTFPGEEAVWYLVKKPELFANAGKAYKLEWSVFQGTAPIAPALITSAIDCGTQSPISLARGAIDAGLQVYILGAMVDEKPGYFSVFWAVRDNSPIQKVEDLKGKTIGSTAIGGGTYYNMRLAFQAHGIDPDNDVKMVEMPFPVQDAALRGERVDLAVYAQPWGGATLRKGGVRKLFTSAEVFSPLINVFETCRKDFADKNPVAVKAFMEDYAAAMKYALAHPDETKKVVSEVTKVPVDVLDSFLLTTDDFYRPEDARPNFAAIQAMWDGYAKSKIIERQLKVSDFQRLDLTPGGK